MAFGLFDRIGRLLAADAHGIVESLEERSLLLKQYLREAELELNRKRARLETVRDEEKRLRDAIARAEEEVRALDEDVALALAAGKDDLARFAIRRLLPRRAEAKTLGTRLAERTAEAAALAERIEVQQAQLETLRARVRAELAREAAGVEAPPWGGGTTVVADEDVELELMRRREAAGGTA
jgi:phage shock protein A